MGKLAFEKLPDTAAGLDSLRKQISDALSEGTLAVCWLIAKWVIRYGPAAITIVEILLVELGIKGGIKGLGPDVSPPTVESVSPQDPQT